MSTKKFKKGVDNLNPFLYSIVVRKNNQEKGTDMKVNILDKFGKVVRQHKVKNLTTLAGLIRDKYPEFDRMNYSLEIIEYPH